MNASEKHANPKKVASLSKKYIHIYILFRRYHAYRSWCLSRSRRSFLRCLLPSLMFSRVINVGWCTFSVWVVVSCEHRGSLRHVSWLVCPSPADVFKRKPICGLMLLRISSSHGREHPPLCTSWNPNPSPIISWDRCILRLFQYGPVENNNSDLRCIWKTTGASNE